MLTRSASAIALSCFVGLAAAPAVHAGDVNWVAFAQSPGGLAAIATAVGMLGTCAEPFAFRQEDAEDDKVRVSVGCHEPDNETDVILTFERIGPHLFIRNVDIAG